MPYALMGLLLSLQGFFSLSAVANESEALDQTIGVLEEEVQQPIKREWQVLLAAGYRTDFQKSIDTSSYESKGKPAYSLGFQTNHFQYLFSYFQSEQFSQVGNLVISSQRQSGIFDIHYLTKDWGVWSPMVGVSLGFYQDEVTTKFGSQMRSSDAETLMLGGLTAGVQFRFLKVMYSDLLVKMVKRETSKDLEWASQATLGLRL